MHHLLVSMCQPVNPEHFLYLSQIFSLASHGDIPSPLSDPLPPDSESCYRLSDIPINRGMFAVVGEARSLGIEEYQLRSVMHRLMVYMAAVQSLQNTAWIKAGSLPGELAVCEHFIRACAVCKFTKSGRSLNLKDLQIHANRFAEADHE